jgi:glycosyltransferase involved in cell wall biosynthesis
MKKVSIILPVYNGESTIAETIASVQKQSYDNFELLVIDDGSTDNTLMKIKEINDPRIRIFPCFNQERALARNKGISEAEGEYIAFLDADDLWASDKLELQVLALEQSPEVGVAYSWIKFIDEQGQYLFDREPLYYKGNVYSDILVNNFISCGSNILVRKKIIDLVGGFDPLMIPAEDWDYNIRLASLCPFTVVQKYQVYYRIQSPAIPKKVCSMEDAMFKVVEKAFQATPLPFQPLRSAAMSVTYRLSARMYSESSLPGFEKTKIANQKILRALQAYPQILFERKTLSFISKLFLANVRFLFLRAA